MLAHPTPCPYIFFHSSRSLVHPFSIHVPIIAHFCHPCSISFPSSVHPFSTHASPSTCSTHCPSVFDECLSFSISFHPFPPTSPFPSRRIIRINVRHDADYAGAAGDAVHYGHPPKVLVFGYATKTANNRLNKSANPLPNRFSSKGHDHGRRPHLSNHACEKNTNRGGRVERSTLGREASRGLRAGHWWPAVRAPSLKP